MKTIIVGDLHGKFEIARKALDTPYNIVFLGDYLDSPTRSGSDQIDTLLLVLEAAEDHPERVTALLGNHELSYLESSMRCSGWKIATEAHVTHLRHRMWKTLKNYYWLTPTCLISHAGVSKKILKALKITLEDYIKEGEFYQIGRSRGGRSPYGGLFWCDWYEDFVHVPGITQVVGHSSYRKTGRNGVIKEPGILSKTFNLDDCRSYNIDCLDRVLEVLLIHEDGTPEIITL